MIRRSVALASVLLVAGCSRAVDDLADGYIVLPPVLHEISGLAVVDAHTIACVQDEVGAVFFVDLRGRAALRIAPFGANGDYEGIAFTGTEYWILRSDGALLQLAQREFGFAIAATHWLPKDSEYEGLCFDAQHLRLLVLPKRPTIEDEKNRDRRRVLAFDLRDHRLDDRAVVTLGVEELVAQAEARGFELPMRVSKKGNPRVDVGLRGSEIAVVPGTDELLLLFGADQLLLRVDAAGKLLGTCRLDAGLLPQPEGMAFLGDGRLLVASEGVGGPARLVAVGDWR